MPPTRETGASPPAETFSPAARDAASPASRRPILLVGHGTRDAAGAAEFLELAARVAELAPDRRVEPSFLELVEPSIAAGLGKLLAGGARECVVAPLLLFAAGHANRDVPDAVHAALGDRPDFAWRQAGPLDPHEPLLRLSHRRFLEARAKLERVAGGPIPPEETHVVWIGRGSSDPAALDNLRGFARRRAELFAGESATAGSESFGFVAVAAPKYRDALAAAARSTARCVIVQPHLLFRGRVLDDVREAACDASALNPQQRWVVAGPLGPDPLLAESVLAGVAACERDWTPERD